MGETLAIVGPVVVAGTWLLIRADRASIWVANTIAMGVLGFVSILVIDLDLVEPNSAFGTWTWVGIGGLAGLALYGGTRAFMAVAGRWPPLAHQTRALYGNRDRISLRSALALSVLIVAPGEELLWRGVVLSVVTERVATIELAGIFVWLAYLVANVFSGSLPIALGAAVSGAVWTALGVSSGGVLAPIACHVVWTGLMIALPPVPAPR
jgi:membrane protease YdiL (CAAX protease family)